VLVKALGHIAESQAPTFFQSCKRHRAFNALAGFIIEKDDPLQEAQAFERFVSMLEQSPVGNE
jgi:hypothetical protein